jgi:hypothetical protein
MSLYYNISVTNAGYSDPPQTLFVGSNGYGDNFIQGNGYDDTIYGESQYSLYSGIVGGNTIYGGGGSNTIYGDAYGLYGTVTAHSNTIWADSPSANSIAADTIYGNAYIMGGDSTGGTDVYGNVVGNTIIGTYGEAGGFSFGTSYLYGNAYDMEDHAWGGHNLIEAFSNLSEVFGDAYQIDGSASYDSTHGYAVLAGGNTIDFYSNIGDVFGDAYSISGEFSGGHNTIQLFDAPGDSRTIACGTASDLYGSIVCGNNVINFMGSDHSHYFLYGDAYSNHGFSIGGNNKIGGNGNATIYGDCQSNYGRFVGGFNTIAPDAGNSTIYGDCDTNTGTFQGGFNWIAAWTGDFTIYGDCVSNTGTFSGGHNTITAGTGNGTIYGDCVSNADTFSGGHNTITAGTGNCTIYGDCFSNTGNFSGGHNTIYAGSGNAIMYGSATDGQNTFVFGPGAGLEQIGSWNSNGSVFQGFDQEGGTALNHAQGDVIDVSAYHLGGFQNLLIGANAGGDAVVFLPAAGGVQGGQLTLVGVHPLDLTASDFHF